MTNNERRAVAFRRQIRLEERALPEAFGVESSTYQDESWALVPFVI